MKAWFLSFFLLLTIPIFATDFFLVVLVNARHLDYSDNRKFLQTLVKHPSDGSKNSDVGHAWIYLQGIIDGKKVYIEGGHSGERGTIQPRYFEGVWHNLEKEESNPINYLWETQHDGFFQEGSGGHRPNYAVKINISSSQFFEILNFIQEYPYENYSITKNQCASFVANIVELAGYKVEHTLTMNIQKNICISGEDINLWENPIYSKITISTPDILEKSLRKLVAEGKAQNVLNWYCRTHKLTFLQIFKNYIEMLYLFPSRIQRVIEFS